MAEAMQHDQPATAQETVKQDPLQGIIAATQAKSAQVESFELKQREAKLFSMSGLFADIKGQSVEQSIAQAFVKISLGETMGFNAAESMTGIDIIQGRVAISANMRAARMQRSGYDWDVLQLDDKGCRLRLKYKGQPLMTEEKNEQTGEVRKVPVVIAFMEQDAARAALIGKDNYKKNPRNMYFARAITNAQRWYAPGILSMNILSVEEAQDLPASTEADQPNTTNVVDTQPEPPAATESQRITNAIRKRRGRAQEEGSTEQAQQTTPAVDPKPESNPEPEAASVAKEPPKEETKSSPSSSAPDLFTEQPQKQVVVPPPIDEEGWT